MEAAKIRNYLNDNPHIYARFEAEALRVWRRGFKHYSARTILHYLRHYTAMSADPCGVFKVNNDLSPTLARDFLAKHPEIPRSFFERRTAKVEPQKLTFQLTGD